MSVNAFIEQQAKPLVATFFERASIGGMDVCWEWKGGKANRGYGAMLRRSRGRTSRVAAHRLAFELATGMPLTPDVHLHHLCENRACVNPRHLLATNRVEHRSYHRQQFCARGHELTPENTIVKSVGRSCRICANAAERQRQRERYANDPEYRTRINQKNREAHARRKASQ